MYEVHTEGTHEMHTTCAHEVHTDGTHEMHTACVHEVQQTNAELMITSGHWKKFQLIS